MSNPIMIQQKAHKDKERRKVHVQLGTKLRPDIVSNFLSQMVSDD